MEINIISVESSFSLFLDSTFLGNGSCLANCGDTSTFSVQVFHLEETFINFNLEFWSINYHRHFQSQAPGELIIKAQVMTYLQIKSKWLNKLINHWRHQDAHEGWRREGCGTGRGLKKKNCGKYVQMGLLMSSSHGLVTDDTWRCRWDDGSNFLPPIRFCLTFCITRT